MLSEGFMDTDEKYLLFCKLKNNIGKCISIPQLNIIWTNIKMRKEELNEYHYKLLKELVNEKIELLINIM